MLNKIHLFRRLRKDSPCKMRRRRDESSFTLLLCLRSRALHIGAAIDNDLSRVDSSVLALLFLGLLVFQLDRMNIASALTGGFAKDIHVTQSTVNAGNQLMFMGIVVLEIPSNMLLQHVRSNNPPTSVPWS